MTSSIEDEVNYTSLVELFGTFFEKITTTHPKKDTLNKHLSDFKRVLYSNKYNYQKIDMYLEDLPKKHMQSHDSSPYSQEKISAYETSFSPSKAGANKSVTSFKTFGPEDIKTGQITSKFETRSISDFIKSRSLDHSHQRQSLLNKYRFVQELELDSSNFYRTIAVGIISQLIQEPASALRLTEMIDDVRTRRVTLKSYYHAYSHEQYSSVFCGYITQIIKEKNSQKPIDKILELFHQMVKYDYLFSLGLLNYFKGKLILFITKELPKSALGNVFAIEQLKSPDAVEKILNNSHAIFEAILVLLPHIFDLKITTQTIENGNLVEKIYSKDLPSSKRTYFSFEENRLTASLHILMEKIFTTCNFYLLVPCDQKTLNIAHLTQQFESRTQLSDQLYEREKLAQVTDFSNIRAIHSSKTDSPVKQKMYNTFSNGFYSPKAGTENLQIGSNSPTKVDNEHKKRDQFPGNTRLHLAESPKSIITAFPLKGLSPSQEALKNTANSEKKKQYPDMRWIAPTSPNASKNEFGTFRFETDPGSPLPFNELKSKDQFYWTKTSGNKSTPYLTEDSPSVIANYTDRANGFLNQPEVARPSDVSQNSYMGSQTKPDEFIRARIKPSFTTHVPSADRGASMHSKTNSFSYSGNPFSSKPYDKNNLNANQTYQNCGNINNTQPIIEGVDTSTFNSNATVSTAMTASTTMNNFAIANPISEYCIKDTIQSNQKEPYLAFAFGTNGNHATNESSQLARERIKGLTSGYANEGKNYLPVTSSPHLGSKTMSSFPLFTQNYQESTLPKKDQQYPKHSEAINVPSYSGSSNFESKTFNSFTRPPVSPQRVISRVSYDEKRTPNNVQDTFASRFSVNTPVKNS